VVAYAVKGQQYVALYSFMLADAHALRDDLASAHAKDG
jgi:hypothetical protein